jgi:hypothetical protein
MNKASYLAHVSNEALRVLQDRFQVEPVRDQAAQEALHAAPCLQLFTLHSMLAR